jgi:hypothetical protein
MPENHGAGVIHSWLVWLTARQRWILLERFPADLRRRIDPMGAGRVYISPDTNQTLGIILRVVKSSMSIGVSIFAHDLPD